MPKIPAYTNDKQLSTSIPQAGVSQMSFAGKTFQALSELQGDIGKVSTELLQKRKQVADQTYAMDWDNKTKQADENFTAQLRTATDENGIVKKGTRLEDGLGGFIVLDKDKEHNEVYADFANKTIEKAESASTSTEGKMLYRQKASYLFGKGMIESNQFSRLKKYTYANKTREEGVARLSMAMESNPNYLSDEELFGEFIKHKNYIQSMQDSGLVDPAAAKILTEKTASTLFQSRIKGLQNARASASPFEAQKYNTQIGNWIARYGRFIDKLDESWQEADTTNTAKFASEEEAMKAADAMSNGKFVVRDRIDEKTGKKTTEYIVPKHEKVYFSESDKYKNSGVISIHDLNTYVEPDVWSSVARDYYSAEKMLKQVKSQDISTRVTNMYNAALTGQPINRDEVVTSIKLSLTDSAKTNTEKVEQVTKGFSALAADSLRDKLAMVPYGQKTPGVDKTYDEMIPKEMVKWKSQFPDLNMEDPTFGSKFKIQSKEVLGKLISAQEKLMASDGVGYLNKYLSGYSQAEGAFIGSMTGKSWQNFKSNSQEMLEQLKTPNRFLMSKEGYKALGAKFKNASMDALSANKFINEFRSAVPGEDMVRMVKEVNALEAKEKKEGYYFPNEFKMMLQASPDTNMIISQTLQAENSLGTDGKPLRTISKAFEEKVKSKNAIVSAMERELSVKTQENIYLSRFKDSLAVGAESGDVLKEINRFTKLIHLRAKELYSYQGLDMKDSVNKAVEDVILNSYHIVKNGNSNIPISRNFKDADLYQQRTDAFVKNHSGKKAWKYFQDKYPDKVKQFFSKTMQEQLENRVEGGHWRLNSTGDGIVYKIRAAGPLEATLNKFEVKFKDME